MMKGLILAGTFALGWVLLTAGASRADSVAELPATSAVDGLTSATPVQPARRDTTATRKKTAKKKQTKKSSQRSKAKASGSTPSAC